MAYKRLFAVLLGMVMTVEAVPAAVFAAEADLASSGVIAAEEEQAEETEATEASVSETTVKKKETPKTEDKEPSVSETEKTEDKDPEESKAAEPAESETKKEAEPSETETAENEPAGKEPDAAEAPDETNGEDKAPEQTETEINETEAGEKEQAEREPKAAADSEDGEFIFVEGPELVDTYSPSDKPDNDEQLEAYFKKKAEDQVGKTRPVLRKAAPAVGSRLTKDNDRIAYNYFKAESVKVAAGSRTDTVFEIPLINFGASVVNMTWSASDLGVSSVLIYDSQGKPIGLNKAATDAVRDRFKLEIDLQAVDDALLSDCPFELYWFDKVSGVQLYSYALAAKLVGGEYKLCIRYGPTACFLVSADYSGGVYDDKTTGIKGNFLTSRTKISRVNTAVTKAASVVKAAATKTDYQKLVYYCNQICSFVTYNTAAVENPDTPYGDPWQLISVFDGNSKTNVVCEGYAKAFMYLCNLTEFEDDISCIAVTGDIPAGGHMWNVVNMDDGKNYLVDITNFDANPNLYDILFLSGYTSKFTNGYYFSAYKFTYDKECLRTFTSDQLEISNQRYYIARQVKVTANNNSGEPTVSPASAKPSETVKVDPKPKTGYDFDYITVNGQKITGTSFTMKGVPANVEVFYKHKLYTVNVKSSAGGSATATPSSGYYGDTITLDVTPEKGYELDKITVNNGDPLTGKTFTMGLANADVSVTFKKIPYKIKVVAGAHGTASADLEEAGVGDTVTLNLVPEEGYFAKTILVNGEPSIGSTFKMLPEPVTVSVEFDLISQAEVGEIITDGINNYRITNNKMDGTGTVAFTGSANQAASVNIPANIKLKGITYKVTKIATNAFYKNPTVTAVTIGSNVTVIESKAFVGCTRLTKITGGSRVKTIGSRAIITCAKLKSFSISSSVLSKIGSYAFYGDKSLKTLYIRKTTKLKKKSVKKSLKGSKIKTVKVKKSKVRKYKRYFTKKNCGRKVKVKK